MALGLSTGEAVLLLAAVACFVCIVLAILGALGLLLLFAGGTLLEAALGQLPT